MFVLSSRYEHFGLTAIEAMASGTPLVTTAVGPIPEVVGEGAAVLIDPDAPTQLAHSVLSLLDDPRRAAALAERGRARARELSWSAAGTQLDTLYARLEQEVYA